MSVTRVVIVRPRPTGQKMLRQVVIGLALLALFGWWLMLIAGTVTDWDLSYWHTVLSILGLRLAQLGSQYQHWTVMADKDEIR